MSFKHQKSFQMLNSKSADFIDEFTFIDSAGDVFARMVSFSEIEKGKNYPTSSLIYDYLTTDERIECIAGKTLAQTVELAMSKYYDN